LSHITKFSIKGHLASPDVSLDEYVRSRQIALAKRLEQRKAIYLDIKYWIMLRDAATGICTSEDSLQLLALLRSNVAASKVFCPISDSTFAELFKQRDGKTRRATAQLIDELSLGVSLLPFDARVIMEFQNFIYAAGEQRNLPPPRHLVWTKLSYVLGWVHPTQTGFDSATELALQKAFFDHMWSIPLTEVVVTIGDAMPPDESRFQSLADHLNAGNSEHADELRSFQQTYAVEIRGAIDPFAAEAADIVCDIAERATRKHLPRDGIEWSTYVREWKGFLYAALMKEDVQDALRTLHINTCLHAAVRWNKGRQLAANDFHDFHHAAAALGYCDAFLTERSLKAMVTASNIALDKRFNCEVRAGLPDALQLLLLGT
jgi:hypothetical protein